MSICIVFKFRFPDLVIASYITIATPAPESRYMWASLRFLFKLSRHVRTGSGEGKGQKATPSSNQTRKPSRRWLTIGHRLWLWLWLGLGLWHRLRHRLYHSDSEGKKSVSKLQLFTKFVRSFYANFSTPVALRSPWMLHCIITAGWHKSCVKVFFHLPTTGNLRHWQF